MKWVVGRGEDDVFSYQVQKGPTAQLLAHLRTRNTAAAPRRALGFCA